jgi:hypothetical protein
VAHLAQTPGRNARTRRGEGHDEPLTYCSARAPAKTARPTAPLPLENHLEPRPEARASPHELDQKTAVATTPKRTGEFLVFRAVVRGSIEGLHLAKRAEQVLDGGLVAADLDIHR